MAEGESKGQWMVKGRGGTTCWVVEWDACEQAVIVEVGLRTLWWIVEVAVAIPAYFCLFDECTNWCGSGTVVNRQALGTKLCKDLYQSCLGIWGCWCGPVSTRVFTFWGGWINCSGSGVDGSPLLQLCLGLINCISATAAGVIWKYVHTNHGFHTYKCIYMHAIYATVHHSMACTHLSGKNLIPLTW